MAALDNPFYFSLAEEDKIEVLKEKTSVKYYNIKGISHVEQRGSFAARRGGPGLASPFPRKMKSGEMLDIAIFSCKKSDAASLWVKYLTSCFQQICKEEKRPPFKLAAVDVEEMSGGQWSYGAEYSRLQIVIVCPMMLEALGSTPGGGILASSLQPATVLAMLLGVTSNALDFHHLAGVFRFEQWRRLVVKDQDPTFVGDFMGVSMDILSRSWQLEQAIHQMNIDNNKAHFSIVPKKIKVGQNKLIILLTTPMSTSDKINISVDKNGQQIQIPNVKRRNPYTLQFSMPMSCLQTSMLVAVNVERNGRSLGQRLVKCESRLRELDQLLKSVDNPVHFMCQALGFSLGDKEQLDTFLMNALQKNMPPNFHLLSSPQSPPSVSNEEFPTLLHFSAKFGLEKLCWQLLDCPGGDQACQVKNSSQQTPADLAEKGGHLRLAHTLKGYMQMTEFSSMYHYMKGISEKPECIEEGNYLLPRPLSDTYLVPPSARPVSPVASPLDNYQSPHTPPITLPLPLDNYQSPVSSPLDNYQSPVASPHPIDSYQSPVPSPHPIDSYQSPVASPHPLDNYQSPPHARPFTPATPTTPSTPSHDFSTYLHMHSPNEDVPNLRLDLEFCQGRYKNVDAHSHHSDQGSISNGHHTVSVSCNSSTSGKMSPQDELVEIINDFKNNVFTISEVEKLVEAWRNRNDVQQSFKEKQEQLNHMRQEYDKIQQAMKDQMKRATPFERIKKFFSRKSKYIENHGKGKADNVNHRPVSSLSLHSSCSSSSSGQMSTGSGTSLGDSGTHSDHDEKKSEDFIFHEKLQAVKESENSGTSFADDYVPRGNFRREEEEEDPVGNVTVALIHHHDIKDDDEKEEEKVEVTEEATKEEKDEKIEEIKKEEEEEGEKEKTEMAQDEGYVESKEMVILEQSERLLKDMAETLTRKLSEAEDVQTDSSEVPDYVNVSPLPPPPVPPRAKYKSVIL